MFGGLCGSLVPQFKGGGGRGGGTQVYQVYQWRGGANEAKSFNSQKSYYSCHGMSICIVNYIHFVSYEIFC